MILSFYPRGEKETKLNTKPIVVIDGIKQKPLSFWNRTGYGLGGMASNLIYNMISIYIVYFYTDVFGIAGGIVSTLLLVTRIWDALNDPLMGFISDHTRTRWGKFRPFMLYGAFPLMIVAVLTFTTPDWGTTAKVIYAFVAYILLDFVYTMVNIPYTSLPAAITQDTHERSRLSGSMLFFSNIAALIVGVATKPLVALFPSEQSGFQWVMGIYAALAVVLFLVCFLSNKEKVEVKNQVSYPVKDIYRLLFQNKPLILLCTALFFVGTASAMRIGSAVYYFKYNIQRDDLFPLFMLTVILCSAIAALFTPALSSRLHSKRNTYFIGASTFIVGDLGIFLTPFTNIPMIFLFAVIAGLGSGMTMVLIWSMVADTVEYGEWKTGMRGEGIILASFQFVIKLSSAVGGAIQGAILVATGYIANAVQPPSVQFGFLSMIALFPIIAGVIAIITLLFYRLDDRQFKTILAEIEARRK